MPSESEFKEQQARLDSLRAFVAEKEEGISSALEVLRTGDDPIRCLLYTSPSPRDS